MSETGEKCIFFKAPVRPKKSETSTKRQRQSSSDSSSSSSDDGNQPSAAECRSANKVQKGLVTMSKNKPSIRRRHDDSDEESTSKLSVQFRSDRQADRSGPKDMGATATTEIDTDLRNDQQAIFERAKKINEELKGKADDKVYRGINNYQQFYEKRDTAQGNASSGLVRNKGLI